uniref:Uncharacterized protein n=1 Tax=Cacopsylla melanoneura TaxID=428564 RepID=A0A8D8VE63_9HEMI
MRINCAPRLRSSRALYSCTISNMTTHSRHFASPPKSIFRARKKPTRLSIRRARLARIRSTGFGPTSVWTCWHWICTSSNWMLWRRSQGKSCSTRTCTRN